VVTVAQVDEWVDGWMSRQVDHGVSTFLGSVACLSEPKVLLASDGDLLLRAGWACDRPTHNFTQHQPCQSRRVMAVSPPTTVAS
jgi:hypothetical protein